MKLLLNWLGTKSKLLELARFSSPAFTGRFSVSNICLSLVVLLHFFLLKIYRVYEASRFGSSTGLRGHSDESNGLGNHNEQVGWGNVYECQAVS